MGAIMPLLYIDYIEGKGMGVFAKKKIIAAGVIEKAPILILPETQWADIKKTGLRDYCYRWDDDKIGFVLGYGSLYNHSYNPNGKFIKKYAEKVMEFVALRDIEEGEEITVNYNYGFPDTNLPLWFEVIE